MLPEWDSTPYQYHLPSAAHGLRLHDIEMVAGSFPFPPMEEDFYMNGSFSGTIGRPLTGAAHTLDCNKDDPSATPAPVPTLALPTPSCAIPISGRRSPIAADLTGYRVADAFAAAVSSLPPPPFPSTPGRSSGAVPVPTIFHHSPHLPRSSSSYPSAESFSPQSASLQTSVFAGSPPRSLADSTLSFCVSPSSQSAEQIERRRRRKETHNAIERRRRDLMNILIARLSILVFGGGAAGPAPASASAEVVPAAAHASGAGVEQEGGACRMNKIEILEASVRRLLLVQNALSELSQHLQTVDPECGALRKYSDLLGTLVTGLPDLAED